MLLATAVCNFSTSELQKVLRDRHFDLEMCFSPQRRAIFQHLNFQKWSENVGVLYIFHLEMCFSPPRRAMFQHLNFQKWSENVVFCTFSLGNVLLATAGCNLSTSQLLKSAPKLTVFEHIDLEICFSPQRRAIFRHLHFKKCSEPDVFCTFSLENVLLATAACLF